MEGDRASGVELRGEGRAARQVAAATAVDRGETETERAASALLDNVGTLGAALGAAGVDLHHAAEGVTTEGV